MAKSVIIELHIDGFRRILGESGVKSVIEANTTRICTRANSISKGYGATGEPFTQKVKYLAPGQKTGSMAHPEHSGRWCGFVDSKRPSPGNRSGVSFGDLLEHKYKVLSRAVSGQ